MKTLRATKSIECWADGQGRLALKIVLKGGATDGEEFTSVRVSLDDKREMLVFKSDSRPSLFKLRLIPLTKAEINFIYAHQQ